MGSGPEDTEGTRETQLLPSESPHSSGRKGGPRYMENDVSGCPITVDLSLPPKMNEYNASSVNPGTLLWYGESEGTVLL